jgi:hypothetical protein
LDEEVAMKAPRRLPLVVLFGLLLVQSGDA